MIIMWLHCYVKQDDLGLSVLVWWNRELKQNMMVSVKAYYSGNQFIAWFKEKWQVQLVINYYKMLEDQKLWAKYQSY